MNSVDPGAAKLPRIYQESLNTGCEHACGRTCQSCVFSPPLGATERKWERTGEVASLLAKCTTPLKGAS